MINNTNSPSFGANLRIATPVKNGAKLQNIQKAFAEKTSDIKGTLSISNLGKEWDNLDYLHLGKNTLSHGAFFKNSLNTLVETLSEEEVVAKLIKGLKGLKEVQKKEIGTLGFREQEYRAQHEQERNMLIAQNYRQQGKDTMASRFEYLAECFGKKVEKIENETNRINSNFAEKLEAIAEGDEDVLNFLNII